MGRKSIARFLKNIVLFAPTVSFLLSYLCGKVKRCTQFFLLWIEIDSLQIVKPIQVRAVFRLLNRSEFQGFYSARIFFFIKLASLEDTVCGNGSFCLTTVGCFRF
jgi:hypothetical protein